MHALKSPFLRPLSRPSSPVPNLPLTRIDTDTADQRAPRPLTKLSSLTTFRKPSPAPVTAPTQSTLVHDGTYLDALSLKLSEAVSKAIAQPVSAVATLDTYGGKRPLPSGRGRALGNLIASELIASQGNLHLQRAILRSLQKPLTVLLTNLSALLLPLLSAPAFSNPPAPTIQNPNPNAVQAHTLGVATFAGELLECLEDLHIDASHDHKGDGLTPIKEGLSSLIKRVINPLIGGIKAELLPMIQDLEKSNLTSVSSSGAGAATKSTSGTKSPVGSYHPSIVTLQALMPVYARALGRYCSTSKCIGQAALATFLISVIWNAVVALSHRPAPPRSRANSSSASAAATSMGMTTFKKKLGGSTTPPTTPPASRFTMKLPGSRPPSPQYNTIPNAVADARTLYDLLTLLPKPSAPASEGCMNGTSVSLAQEAVDEAFEALMALTALLAALDTNGVEVGEVRDDIDLDLLTEGLPLPIALPVLLRWSGHGEPHVIPHMLGISEAEYRGGCLSGFGRADECENMISRRMLEVLQISESEFVKESGVVVDGLKDDRTAILLRFLEGCIVH